MFPQACAPSIAEVARAAWLIDCAAQDAGDLQRRVRALAGTTEWSARAADSYRSSLARLTALLDNLAWQIDVVERDIAALHARTAAEASCR